MTKGGLLIIFCVILYEDINRWGKAVRRKEKSAMFGGKMSSGGNEEGCWKPQALLVDLQCGSKGSIWVISAENF